MHRGRVSSELIVTPTGDLSRPGWLRSRPRHISRSINAHRDVHAAGFRESLYKPTGPASKLSPSPHWLVFDTLQTYYQGPNELLPVPILFPAESSASQQQAANPRGLLCMCLSVTSYLPKTSFGVYYCSLFAVAPQPSTARGRPVGRASAPEVAPPDLIESSALVRGYLISLYVYDACRIVPKAGFGC